MTAGTAFAAMKSSSIYVCGCERKQSQRRDGRTDGCGDSSSSCYKCLAAVVAAEKACPWPFARFAWMLPSPDSRVATDFRPQQPFLIRFDLIIVSYWRNQQNEKRMENEVILKGFFQSSQV